MATITLTVANNIAARALAGIAGYYTTLRNEPPNANESTAAYVQRKLAEDAKAKVLEYESYVANVAVTASVTTDIVIS